MIEVIDGMLPGERQAEILLVEDNEGDVILAMEAFKASKVSNNVSVASDGEEALRMLTRVPPYENQPVPDIVLLDLNLPKRDGREVLEFIKGHPQLCSIPVVVLTGSNAETEIARTYALHANAYIVKPVTFERLREVVRVTQQFWFSVVVRAPAPKLSV